ncbi:MAG: HIT domain-containing protein [Candidatus Eisenbacteria bacterium]
MDRLWATWRMPYIDTLKERGEEGDGCVFCDKPREGTDEESYILLRRPKTFVIQNAFPYNPGHIMIAPYRHVARFADLGGEERGEIGDLLVLCETVIERVFRPNGMNVGVNLGRAAGAGVPGHIHVHLVPRWQGDSNFMPLFGGTKVIPQGLRDTYGKLKEALDALEGPEG